MPLRIMISSIRATELGGSFRILFATRVQGRATDYSTSIGTMFGRRTVMPVTLRSFQKTPMKKAIRVCIEQAVAYLCTKTRGSYYPIRVRVGQHARRRMTWRRQDTGKKLISSGVDLKDTERGPQGRHPSTPCLSREDGVREA
jgi:hypothetical protein